MKTVDSIIHADHIATVDNNDTVLNHHALIVHQGKIIDIVPSSDVSERFESSDIVHLPDHILCPGFVNAHTHAAMNLLRGYADDYPLMTWLNDYIWPAEGQWVDPAFVATGSRLAIAEMLRSGTTCFNDMYFFPDITAVEAESAGIRACIGLIVIDFPTCWASSGDEYFAKAEQVHKQFLNSDLISTALAPHAPYTVCDDNLKRVIECSDRLNTPIQMHIHETAFEVSQSEEQIGKRPLKRLEELGLLNSRLQAVHMTQVNEQEISQLNDLGVHVIHCPQSNLKLASGFCPIAKLSKAGVNIALGTDGSASNNDLDMLNEMQTAALLAKGASGDAAAVPASEALRMATINGAKAMGLAHITGSLEIGKCADIQAIDLGQLETSPRFDPISQVVYSASRHQVTHLWVHGKQLMKHRQLTTIDETKLLSEVKEWQAKLLAFRNNQQSS
jgi:5-methylthioadenosine/S-adenosylhomocysteine deaminase